jgi:Uma2 family endonuclease
MTVMTVEALVPQRLKMSYEKYLEYTVDASDSRIIEWVDGEVIYYMPPLDIHQNISRFLTILLDAYIEFFDLGVLRYAPLEVKLWPDGPAREPDILFIAQHNRSGLTDKRFEGGPDLVVEIVSTSSVTEDRVYKFTEYERAGVREYWLIDPRPYQQQADFYLLDSEGVYRPAPVDEVGIYHSTVLPDFWLKLNWLWQEELPNPQLALAEIMISNEALSAEAKEAYQAMYRLLNR